MAAGRSLFAIRALLCVVVLASAAGAQAPDYQSKPREFVRVAIYNELHSHSDGERFMWRDTEKKPKAITTKVMVETSQGVISRLIAFNGRPLTADERAQDDARVNRLLTDPSALRKKQQQQKDDEEHARRVMASIPDAFIFKYDGTEESKSGKVVHYTFQPDPSFDPPNHESKVLQGMKGDLFIDIDAKRIAKLDGTLFENVDFGWGILGHLDKGGRFVIEQSCIGGNRWETTRSLLHFTGKALMVKSINIQEDESLFDFQPVKPNLTIAQGIELMKKSDDTVAENGGGNGQK
jgi:hypothetical protein